MADILNAQQMEAVTAEGAPVLVLAGAGSGKTRVITHKIAYTVEMLHRDPASILAVTFTNKAAKEMRERLMGMIHPQQASRVVIRTFHSFGAWVLRRHAAEAGLNPNFTIYDDEDSLTLLHGLYPEYKRKDLSPYMRTISRVKDQGLGVNDDISLVTRDSRIAEMYRRYQRRLGEIGNVDFGDLILSTVKLLKENREVREYYRSRFSTILVDEYQDTNSAQYELLKGLYSPQTHLCVVGDDDQSIYRFRGAEVEHILQFPRHFPGTLVVKLEQNYRSTGRILAIASEVVRNNSSRHEKTLWSERPMGPKAKLVFVEDHAAEAEYCASLLKRTGGINDTAILYRTNAQSAAFETVLLREQIPYKIIGALRFFDREEVKDALALLSLLVNPADEVALKRMINKPARGIGKGSLAKILSYDAPVMEACSQASGELRGRAKDGVRDFLQWYDESSRSLEQMELSQWITDVLDRSGLVAYHRRQDLIASTQKEANLEELVNSAALYPSGMEGLRAFLETMELDRTRLAGEDPESREGVTLITMHNTKGLEFPRVIISGMEEGLFPSRRSSDSDDIEEERRIFYVSITRAKEELYFTSCRRRFLWGTTTQQAPSRFLRELPEEHLETVGMGFSTPERRRAPYAQKPKPADTPAFSPGDWIYHDAYGNGCITHSWIDDSGREVVKVTFETGRQARFLSAYAPLEKVAHD